MRDDKSKKFRSETVRNALSLVKELTDSETERRLRSERGSTPVPAGPPPGWSAKIGLLNEMEKARSAARSDRPISASEHSALSKYIDLRASEMGPSCTASDFTDFDRKSIVSFATKASDNTLYSVVNATHVDSGPVQRALLIVPYATTPDFPEEPQPPSQPDPGEPGDPPKEPVKMTSAQVVTLAKRKGWTMEQAEKYSEDLFENEMAAYEKVLADIDAAKALHEEWERYAEEKTQWDTSCTELELRAKKVEDGLALGGIVVDYDQTEEKYSIAINQDNSWQVVTTDKASQARKKMIDLVDALSSKYVVGLSDDMLAAIATGDLLVTPIHTGFTITLQPTAGGTGIPEDVTDLTAVSALVAGYIEKQGLDYDKLDGKVYSTREELKVLASTFEKDAAGDELCPYCSQKKDQESGLPVRRQAKSAAEKYEEGYALWEKTESAAGLVKIALQAAKGKTLTDKDLNLLCWEVDRILGRTSPATNFKNRLTELCYGVSEINHNNLTAFLDKFGKTHKSPKIKKRDDAGVDDCPVCGKEIPPEAPQPNTPEVTSKPETEITGIPPALDDTVFGEGAYQTVGSELFHDGTQQAFNPFGHPSGRWVTFSFRPGDLKKNCPNIGIVPASFQSIKTINSVLNTFPYIIIGEYFMRNNVSSTLNLIQAVTKSKADKEDAAQASEPADIQSITQTLNDKIKAFFEQVGQPGVQVIDMPFVLYHRMKAKLHGNEYRFPYIPGDNPITKASNSSEWNGQGGILTSMINKGAGFLNAAEDTLGFGFAKPFPAPTWKLPDSGGYQWDLTFTLNLINDEFMHARNNYICANTLLNNNRWIQKAIIEAPGALYDISVPTGVRELMCTGDFTLRPLGVNRHVPDLFFTEPFVIGTNVYGAARSGKMHDETYEVIPDAYALDCTFKSCISENLNNSVFSYYLDIVKFEPGQTEDSGFMELLLSVGNFALAAEQHVEAAPDVGINDLHTTFTELMGLNQQAAAAQDEKKNEDDAEDKDDDADDDDDQGNNGNNQGGGDNGGNGGNGGDNGGGNGGDNGGGDNGGNGGGTGGGGDNGGGATSVPAPRTFSNFRKTDMTELYSERYDALRTRLKSIKERVVERRRKLEELAENANKLPLSDLRKVNGKRMRKINDEINDLIFESDSIEKELIDLEMRTLLHGKDEVEKRTESPRLAVPRGYFDPPGLDDLELLKIRLLTREERKDFLANIANKIASLDKWGIHECKDFRIRCGVIMFILDAMQELMDLMRDTIELMPEAHDRYKYRYSMLKTDLDAALDASKPFMLNKTNIVYIPIENIPEDLLGGVSEDEVPNVAQDNTQQESQNGNQSDDGITDVVPVTGGDMVEYEEEPLDKAQLVELHRAEVVKQVFGNEDGLAAEAFKSAVENESNPAAANDRTALIMLKKSPELDDVEDMVSWFDRPEYSEIHSRMLSDVEGVRIFDPDVDKTKVNRAMMIRFITQDLYRYVSSWRTVLLNNAMDSVDTKAGRLLFGVTEEIKRLEN